MAAATLRFLSMGDDEGNGIGAGSYGASMQGIGRGAGEGDGSGDKKIYAGDVGAGIQGHPDGNNRALVRPIGCGSFY